MANSESTSLDLEQMQLRLMQMKLRDEEEKKDLLIFVDHLHENYNAENSSNADTYRKLKKDIRNASTAKMDVIEAIDTDVTGILSKSNEIDDRTTRRLEGLIPSDDRE